MSLIVIVSVSNLQKSLTVSLRTFYRNNIGSRPASLLACFSASLFSRITLSHSSRSASLRLSYRKTVCPCRWPQKLVVLLPAVEKKGDAVTADYL